MKTYLQLPPKISWPFSGSLGFSVQGDFDGDGRQEILLADTPITDSSLAVVSYFRYDDVLGSWASTSYGSLATTGTSSGWILSTASETKPWEIGGDDVYVVIDLDQDGADEIVAFSPDHLWIGVLKWSTTGLVLVWATGSPGPGWFLLFSDTKLFPVKLADTNDESFWGLVALTPSQGLLTVLSWNGCELSPLWSYDVAISPSTQLCVADVNGDTCDEVFLLDNDSPPKPAVLLLFWDRVLQRFNSVPYKCEGVPPTVIQICAADLDGDGSKELFFYCGDPNDSTGALVALLKWSINSSTLTTLQICEVDISSFSFSGWELSPRQQFAVQHITGQPDQLVAFNPNNIALGVITWAGGQLTTVYDYYAGQGPIPSKGGCHGWVMSTADQRLLADVDGDGAQELLVYNPQDLWMGILKWQDGAFFSVWQAQGTVSGWTLATVAAAPATQFQPFSGNQLDIYKYLSLQADQYCNGDIRDQYRNEDDASSFAAWSTTIKYQTNPGKNPEPPYEVWSEDDWDAVNSLLSAELANVGFTWGFWSCLNYLTSLILAQQQSDFNYTQTMLPPVDPGSAANYCTGQLALAAFVGLAAIPSFGEDLEMVTMLMSVMASFLGSALAWGNLPPQKVSFAVYQKAIADGYLECQKVGSQAVTTILSDPLKLGLMGGLCNGPWYSDLGEYDVTGCQRVDRITMYSNLIPVWYTMVLDNKIDFPYPVQWDSSGGYTSLDAPSWAYNFDTNSDGTYNVQFLCSNAGGEIQYPSGDMMQDLFGLLGVSQYDFFHRLFIWQSIPCVFANQM